MNFKLFFVLTGIVLLTNSTVQAQENDAIKKKVTPYDLMSNYYDNDFNPFKKRNVFVGFSFALEDKRLTNTDYLFQHVIDGEKLNYDIELKAGYFTSDYFMTGLRFNYLRDEFEGRILSTEGLIFTSKDTVVTKSSTNGFSVSPYFRSTIPVTPTDRLSFFTDFSFTFGSSNTDANYTKGNEVETKEVNNFNFKVGLSPGVIFFAMENFALEVQLDLLGYNLDVSNTSLNNGPESTQTRQNVNFDIDILSLKLGLAYYFGAKHIRK